MEADKVQRNIYQSMTPADKLAQVYELREIAWQIKSAGVRAKHPDWSSDQVEAEVRRIFLYATT